MKCTKIGPYFSLNFLGCEYKPGSKWPHFGIDPPARCNECKDCEQNKECVNRPQYNPLRRFSQALLGDPFQPLPTSPTVELAEDEDSGSNIGRVSARCKGHPDHDFDISSATFF